MNGSPTCLRTGQLSHPSDDRAVERGGVSDFLHRDLQARVLTAAFIMVDLSAFMAGCHSIPVTAGASIELPQPSERVLVVGNHPGAVNTGITWLERHRLVVVAPGALLLLPDRTVFEKAKALRVRSLVWVQLTGDLRAPMVAVQGFDPETEAVLWAGHARSASYDSRPPQHEAARLTCHAFAAVWETVEDPPCP